MTIDLIVTWPSNCDYPLFRQWLRNNRSRFNNVYVIQHNTNSQPDFRRFIESVLLPDSVTMVVWDGLKENEDWRDKGINYALADSKSTHVLFIEQDFFMYDGFWTQVHNYLGDGIDGYPVIGILDGKRWHPCFLLMRRAELEKTCKNFGIVPGKLDHFGLIQKDMEAGKCGALTAIPNYTDEEDKLYHHMNGLSHNLRLMFDNQPITYKPDEFKEYLKRTLDADIPQSLGYREKVQEYLAKT